MGEDTSAAAGGAGAHAGTCAGAEGISHGASARAGILPARQTTIAWPIVGEEGEPPPPIPGRWAGTGRAALSHQDRPPGAAETVPGTSGPPGRAAARARDSGGYPGSGLMSAGSGGPGPRGGLRSRKRRNRDQRRSQTRRMPGRKWRTAHRRRVGGAIGTRGP